MAFGKKVFRICSFVLVACSVLAFGLRSGAEPPIPLMRAPEPLPVEEPPPPKIPRAVVEKGFAIAPVTTELQRRLLGQNELDLCVVIFIDGTQLFKTSSALDVSAFDWVELRKGLKTFLQKGKSVAHFHVYYASGDVASSDGLWMVASAMEALAREEGFVPTKTFSWCGLDKKSEFEKFVWPLREATGAANSEAAVGDEVARAYPVHTPLSRVFTQSAAVVDILVPLKQTEDTLPDEVDKSLRAATEKLNLGKNQLIDFHAVTKDDIKSRESGIYSVCKRWIQSAGLKCGSVAVSGN